MGQFDGVCIVADAKEAAFQADSMTCQGRLLSSSIRFTEQGSTVWGVSQTLADRVDGQQLTSWHGLV